MSVIYPKYVTYRRYKNICMQCLLFWNDIEFLEEAVYLMVM